jgi:hypothetical protein
VAALEAAAAEAPAAPVAAAPGLQGAGPARDLAEVRRLAQTLGERVDRLETDATARGAAATPDVARLVALPAFSEAVRSQVLDMAAHDVDFRSRVGTGRRDKLPRNAPFAQVAETLQLDASQEAQMSKDLQETQQGLYAVLSEERADGVVPMDLIARAEKLPPNDPRRAATFVQLFTLKIPGGEETYMQRAVKLQQGFRKKIEAYLRPRQLELLDAVEIDWFSVKFD